MRNSWTFIQTFFVLMEYPWKANQFITPVYKTKYLLKWQYSNHQFIKSMDSLWHVTKLLHKYKLASFFGAKSIVKSNYCDIACTS